MKLYDFAFSSAGYRVRIALNLKGLAYERAIVSLVKDGGQQHDPRYLEINPQGLIPLLEHGDRRIGQSLAIIEYLEEVFPAPALLPREAGARARVRQIAYEIACDIHPVNNLRVRQYLANSVKATKEQSQEWYAHWITLGFQALETALTRSPETGRFCHGDTPTLADICLVPQMANARRFNVPVEAFPSLRRIDEAARALKPFADAAPEAQTDAQ
jgi:maleylpyruvate isomerase